MKPNLKHIELFEGYIQREIPYSKIDINGDLTIEFPESATSVPPVLNQLTTEVTGWIEIKDTTALKTVTGFNKLQSVGGDLWIKNNTELTQVTGFNQLQSVRWSLWITDNTVLQSVTGFNQLQSVGNNLSIRGNTVLQSVTGFNQLQSVGWFLAIKNNTELTQVTGFNQLHEIGTLTIGGNTALNMVTGFDQLKSIWDGLFIMDNSNLVTLSIPSTIIRSVDYKENFIIFENRYRFKSPEEVINSDLMIQDCIEKFNPDIHGDVVVKNICNNLELWGTPETIDLIVNHLKSKGVESNMFDGLLNKRMNHQSGKMIMDRGY